MATEIQKETTETETETADMEEAKVEIAERAEAKVEITESEMRKTEESESRKKSPAKLIMIIIIILLVLAGAAALFMLSRALKNKEQFQGKQWYTDVKDAVSLADTLSGVEVFAAQSGIDGSSLAENWVYGNEMQMYAAGALLTMDEEYYYVANALDNYKLYRISRDSSYNREKISDIPAGMISVRNGRLYFVSSYANVAGVPGIYSVNADGTQPEYMSDAVPEYMMLVNDWLYYLSENDSHIYKMNVMDRREIQLTDKSCVSMTIHENNIYFSFLKDQEDEDAGQILGTMDLDGNSYRGIAEGGEYDCLMYVEGKIYYASAGDQCFCSVAPDGTGASVIVTADMATGLQIYNGNYYFVDKSRGRTIAVYQEALGSIEHYNLEQVKDFFLFDGKIYVNYLDGTEEKVSVHSLEAGSLIPFLGPMK